MSEQERRAEAEAAWDRFTKTHRVAYEWVASVRAGFVEGHLAGDAAGYARCLADIRRMAVHYQALTEDDIPMTPAIVAMDDRLRYLAEGIRTVALALEDGWCCTDPMHAHCRQETEANHE